MVEKEADLSNMIEASDERALTRADREEEGRRRKSELSYMPRPKH